MRIGISALVLAYVLSQFYRAFLAVMTPVLTQDLGVSAADLASASGWWFLAFAAMQVPVGAWLDRVGPRLTTGVLLGLGAAGAVLFAQASGALQIKLAMALIGIGCAPVLMAGYFIFARQFSPAVFGTLAALMLGVGTLGNVAASLPLSWAVTAFGWRETVLGLAAITGAVALAILVLVRDPERLEDAQGGSLMELLKMPVLWPILIMMMVCYAPIAGLRGLWIGPWFADVQGAGQLEIGRVSLWMGLAMVAGNFAYGPLDRWLGRRKALVVAGNAVMLGCLVALWWFAAASPLVVTAILVAAGFFGASFPIVLAHGRSFVPAHLTGRGVTLLNLFGIAPIGIAQIVTGRIHAATAPTPPSAP
ncbi:MFS transporter, partial [Tabrizicola sp.]|uniref:MFS transporter n=1 Tax=Tabrizicola sp. TaxID=2005166 RepID=UPI0035ADFBFC